MHLISLLYQRKRQNSISLVGIPQNKISIISNGIDIATYNELPEKGIFKKKYNLLDKKIVLFLGKITPRKGLDILVRAVAAIPCHDIVLVVAGNDMGFKSKVENIIRELNVQGRVLFTGLLEDRDKISAYVDSDVLVYPSTLEIFGLVPFEAIMCDTPVIVTDDCGCGEIIGKTGAGYLVKYGDIGGLVNTITEVLNNKEGARERVQKGQEFIRQHLRWENISSQTERVYKKLCSINTVD